MPEFRALPGGSQYNCASALGRLGTRPHYITPISTDSLGVLLADTLVESGVVVAAERVDAPSSLAVVTLQAGQPSYQFYRDGTAERLVSAESLKAAMPAQTRVFQIGSLSLCDGDDADVWAKLFIDLAQQGVACTLDPNVRPAFVKDPGRLPQPAGGHDEGRLAGQTERRGSGLAVPRRRPRNQGRRTRRRVAGAAVRADQGQSGRDPDNRSHRVDVEAAPVSALQDTVGAGDTFMAALIYQFLQSPDFASETAIRDVGRFAAKAAAINCERVGCNPPSLDEIRI